MTDNKKMPPKNSPAVLILNARIMQDANGRFGVFASYLRRYDAKTAIKGVGETKSLAKNFTTKKEAMDELNAFLSGATDSKEG